jgi:hypothetical protein
MRPLVATAVAALILGATVSMSAFADTSASTGCSSVTQRTESEGGGVATVGNVTRKAESEGGGVATVGNVTRKAQSEGSGSTVGNATGTQVAASALPCK